MSLPKISDINPNVSITREDSVNILIASVGLEEPALARILNAEGEKIQYVLGTLDGTKPPDDVTVCDVLKVNERGMFAGFVATGSTSVKVSSCCNLETVGGTDNAGGIGGMYINPDASASLKIENCYNTGMIGVPSGRLDAMAGGLMGAVHGLCSIENSYNTGDIYSTPFEDQAIPTGGISGNYGTITDCASLGDRIETGEIIIARISPTTSFASQSILNNNVAFDGTQVLINGVQKSPLDTGSGGTDGISVTAAELKTKALYETTLSWDFVNVWSFGNGDYTLPVLRGIAASLQPDVLPSHLV